MEMRNILTGKLQHVPSENEIAEIKRKRSFQRRMDKKREQAEEAQERELQAKCDKLNGKNKFNSTKALQKSSTELLRQVMAERKISVKKNQIFNAVVKAKLGKQFSRETRADKHKILAVGCAVYHELAAQKSPKEALHRLAESVSVEVNRINDPCRIIVECLVDYGAQGRSADRQYAARDARALSYVIREKLTPQQVMTPCKGENVTVWAKRESEYRSSQRTKLKPLSKRTDTAIECEALPGQLQAASLTQAAYNAIKELVAQGVVVVKSSDSSELLALTITPLNGLSAEKAVNKPGKVRIAIKQTLQEFRQRTSESVAVKELGR
jgi:hypothetical protein